jgi:hypothetical protein
LAVQVYDIWTKDSVRNVSCELFILSTIRHQLKIPARGVQAQLETILLGYGADIAVMADGIPVGETTEYKHARHAQIIDATHDVIAVARAGPPARGEP